MLAHLPAGRPDQFLDIMDSGLFKLDAHGVHELVEEAHHGHAQHQPLDVGIGQELAELEDVFVANGGRDGRNSFGYPDNSLFDLVVVTGKGFRSGSATQSERTGVGRAVHTLGGPAGGVHGQADQIFGGALTKKRDRQIQQIGYQQVVGTESGWPNLKVGIAIGDNTNEDLDQLQHRPIVLLQLLHRNAGGAQMLCQCCHSHGESPTKVCQHRPRLPHPAHV